MVPASDRMEGSTPTVLFGEGHGPESSTHVRFEEFEGPLALLLSLIEARRLDILTVPLAGLTVAYLEALAMLPGDRLGNISSFVTVASQLILIKSRALLPPRGDSTVTGGEALDDAPDPEAELRARLLLYRAYRDAGSAPPERVAGASRSEERRGGEEGRSRGAPGHLKKKKKNLVDSEASYSTKLIGIVRSYDCNLALELGGPLYELIGVP